MTGSIGRRLGGIFTGAMLVALTLAAGAGATTKPPTAPAAHGAISLIGAFTVSHQSVTLSGRSVQFRGVVRPYASGQHTTVRVYFGHRVIKVVQLRIKRSPGGTYGYFEDRVVS